MWLVFGTRTKAKSVPGGREVDRSCAQCARVTRWLECDVKDDYKAFFVKIASTTVRRLVCTECGDDASLDEIGAAPTSRAPKAAAAVPAPRRAPSEAEKDAMLEALKEKMRRNPK